MTLEISAGELVDRITILKLKERRLAGASRDAVRRELAAASAVRDAALAPSSRLRALTRRLAAVNLQLWNVEEELRSCERAGRFGRRFVTLARTVYKANDRRAALKRSVDLLVGRKVGEHKSYALPEIRLSGARAR
jgi:hypothetical protein